MDFFHHIRLLCSAFLWNRKEKPKVKVRETIKRRLFACYISRFTEEGIALIMVLWVLVMLTIVAFNYLGSTRANSASTRNLKEETQSYYMALSGYHEALQYLMSDKDPGFDFFDTEGNFRVDRDTPAVTGTRSVGDGEVDIRITDEDSKININYVRPERLKALLEYAGVPGDAIPELIDSIQDWKDPASKETHRLLGAGDDYYESLADPYTAKHGPFDVPEELLLVKGVKPEYLYGAKDIKPLLPLLTTFGGGGMNINTVSEDVMTMLGLNTFEIEAVMKQRTAEAGGFTFVPEQFARLGFGATSSGVLRIEVTARAHGKGPASKVVAIIKRQPAGGTYKIQTLYWREYAENTRG
jgi:general secretion pathway protein K